MAYQVKGTCVSVEYLVLGMLDNNVYLISDGTSTMVVDPTCKPDVILEALGDRKVDVIVLTHRHFDHVGAARALREKTGAPVIASVVDALVITGEEELPRGDRHFEPCPVDRTVQDGDTVQVGSMAWQVIETPGHTPGGICLYLDPAGTADPDAAPVLVSGDTLFCGTIGRTDFTGGSMSDMRRSLKRLAQLPDNTIVLPGHNSFTTIGAERNRALAM